MALDYSASHLQSIVTSAIAGSGSAKSRAHTPGQLPGASARAGGFGCAYPRLARSLAPARDFLDQRERVVADGCDVQAGDARGPMSLHPITHIAFVANERGCLKELTGDCGLGFAFLAVEVELLDLDSLSFVTEAAEDVGVRVLPLC